MVNDTHTRRRRSACTESLGRADMSAGVAVLAAKCDMRSIVIIIELSYRIILAIILIYRIVYRSKQYLTYRNSTLGRSPSPVRWPGMHCLMTSETHRSVPTISEEAKDASVSECTWTLSALEALLNALYKFKTYVLTYYEVGSPTGSFEPGLHSSLAGRHRRQRNLSSKSCQTKVRCTPSCRE